MPNEVGQVLQDAQDDLQRVSGDPIFFSHSHDLIDDRFQVLDDNWKVCNQNVVPGTRVSAVAHIDFGVVKLSESCP
jgi:5'(3')-deoxyribonucleotidase